MFFLIRYSTSCQVYEACGGGNMNEYVVIYLPFSQHPRLFRGARFRMWGHTRSEKTSQDEISLAVGNLEIVGYGGTQPNKRQSGKSCPMWLQTAWPIMRHFLSVSHELFLSEGREVIERKHI
jgi:hypothetical protein